MTAIPYALTGRHKGFNRAEIVDQNFTEFVQLWQGEVHQPPGDHAPVLPGSALNAQGFRELLESQLISRHLDLMARVLRVQNKVFYTIGSSGHEGNAMVARLTRHTDPAFLHYRSGGFMAERFPNLATGQIDIKTRTVNKDEGARAAAGGRTDMGEEERRTDLPR